VFTIGSRGMFICPLTYVRGNNFSGRMEPRALARGRLQSPSAAMTRSSGAWAA
jgi:hypothetical protein